MKKLYFLLTVLISQFLFLTVKSYAISKDADEQEHSYYTHKIKETATNTENGKENLRLVGNF